MYNPKSNIFILLFSLLSFNAFAQEICNNSIDDDGDGMIDLNDSECSCENEAALAFISDSLCSQVKLIAVFPAEGAQNFQWYKDGIALSGNESYLTGSTNENVLKVYPNFTSDSENVDGNYQCQYELNGNCMQSVAHQYSYVGLEEQSDTVSLCEGESLELISPTGIPYTVSQSGLITAEGFYDNGCPYRHNTYVIFYNQTNTTEDVQICEGASYTFAGTEIVQSGVYETILTGVNGCDSIVTLNLEVIGSSNSIIKVQELDTVCINQSTEYSIPATLEFEEEGIFRYEGLGITDEFSPIVDLDVLSAGKHGYTIEYNSLGGCLLDSKSFELDVMASEAGECLVNSSKDLNEYKLPMTLSPNPSNGLFQLSTVLNNSNTTLELIDVKGGVVYSTIVLDQKSTYDLRHISSGVYLIRISDGVSSRTDRIVITD